MRGKFDVSAKNMFRVLTICLACMFSSSCDLSKAAHLTDLGSDDYVVSLANEGRKAPYPANFEIDYADIEGVGDCGELVPAVFLNKSGVGQDLEIYLPNAIDFHFLICSYSEILLDEESDSALFEVAFRDLVEGYSTHANVCDFVSSIESEAYVNNCLYTDLVISRTLGVVWNKLQKFPKLSSLRPYFERSVLQMAKSRLIIDSLNLNCRDHCSEFEAELFVDASFQAEVKFTLSGIVCEISEGCNAN